MSMARGEISNKVLKINKIADCIRGELTHHAETAPDTCEGVMELLAF